MTNIIVAAHGAIQHNGKVLTIRRSGNDEWMAGKWDFPGGKIDIGETAEMALKREVHEETGLKVKVGQVDYVYTDLSELPSDKFYTHLRLYI